MIARVDVGARQQRGDDRVDIAAAGRIMQLRHSAFARGGHEISRLAVGHGSS